MKCDTPFWVFVITGTAGLFAGALLGVIVATYFPIFGGFAAQIAPARYLLPHIAFFGVALCGACLVCSFIVDRLLSGSYPDLK